MFLNNYKFFNFNFNFKNNKLFLRCKFLNYKFSIIFFKHEIFENK